MDSDDDDEDDEDKDEDELDDETRLDLLKSTIGILAKRTKNTSIAAKKLDILRLKNANRAAPKSRVSSFFFLWIGKNTSNFIFLCRLLLLQLLFILMHKLC